MERHYTPDLVTAALKNGLRWRIMAIKKPAVPVFLQIKEQSHHLVIFLPFHGIKKLIIGLGHLQFVDQEFHTISFIHRMQDFA